MLKKLINRLHKLLFKYEMKQSKESYLTNIYFYPKWHKTRRSKIKII